MSGIMIRCVEDWRAFLSILVNMRQSVVLFPQDGPEYYPCYIKLAPTNIVNDDDGQTVKSLILVPFYQTDARELLNIGEKEGLPGYNYAEAQ